MRIGRVVYLNDPDPSSLERYAISKLTLILARFGLLELVSKPTSDSV